MDGGRKRWELDERAWSQESEPTYPRGNYVAKEPDRLIRAFRDEVLKHQQQGRPLVDVRSPGEYTGEMLHMPDYPQEGALRGGHIPGAVSIPWSKAANEDGTFKRPRSWKSCTSRKTHSSGHPNDRLLPHRRTIEPYLVRAHVLARLQEGQEL